jgi:hypothetical protein
MTNPIQAATAVTRGAVVKALLTAGARQLVRAPMVNALLTHLDDAPHGYLAHEYMNEHWRPCFVADVAAALSDAKLEWIGSSQLIENFPALTMTDAQRVVANRFDEPLMREMIKDVCMERSLRHDLFVRGPRRVDNATRDKALMDIVIGLGIHPDDLPTEIEVPAGQAQFDAAFYRPIVQAASRQATRVGDLLRLPEVEGHHDNPAELLGLLIGANLAYPVLRPGADPHPCAIRFNQIAARRLAHSESLNRVVGIASHRLGAGAHGNLLDMLVLDRRDAGETAMLELLQLIAPAPDDMAKVQQAIEHSLYRKMPILRSAGVY